MEFITANQDLFIIIGVVLGVLSIKYLLIPFLDKKGYLNKENIDSAKDTVELLKFIILSLNLKDDKIKQNAITIFDITKIIVEYVDKNIDLQGENIEDVSFKTVLDILDELGIEVTEDNIKMIELGIKYAINNLK